MDYGEHSLKIYLHSAPHNLITSTEMIPAGAISLNLAVSQIELEIPYIFISTPVVSRYNYLSLMLHRLYGTFISQISPHYSIGRFARYIVSLYCSYRFYLLHSSTLTLDIPQVRNN